VAHGAATWALARHCRGVRRPRGSPEFTTTCESRGGGRVQSRARDQTDRASSRAIAVPLVTYTVRHEGRRQSRANLRSAAVPAPICTGASPNLQPVAARRNSASAGALHPSVALLSASLHLTAARLATCKQWRRTDWKRYAGPLTTVHAWSSTACACMATARAPGPPCARAGVFTWWLTVRGPLRPDRLALRWTEDRNACRLQRMRGRLAVSLDRVNAVVM